MTKEEILIKYTTPASHCQNNEILSAMEEYAKQQAIAFAIDYAKRVLTWIDVNHKKPEDVANDRMEERYAHFIENQFIEQQNKP